MPTPRRTVRQLAEMIEEPAKGLTDPEYWTVSLCRRWLDHAAERAHFDIRQARWLAIVGVRLALRVVRRQERRGLRDRSILARAYGVLGSVYRMAGRLERATRYLDKAATIAERCIDPDVRSDICRRRAILRAHLAQQPDGTLEPAGLHDAERLVQTAVDNARGPLAQARARNTRGMILLYSGDWVRAAQDARWALATLDPEEWPYDQVAALSLLVNALLEGDKADRAEAAGCLERLRHALPPRCPAIRGRVLWAEALLYFHDRQRKGRTRKLLNQARKRFVRRGMDAEAVAVTAELARHAPEGAVPRLCADLLPILTPGPIRDLVEELRGARVVDRVAIAERLRRMVEGPGVLPAAT